MDNPQQAVATLERTPLAASLHATAVEEYCGAFTIPSFDGIAAETDALIRSCGIFDIGYASLIRVTGEDQVRWLNGMVTNSVQGLSPGIRNYNFVLNAQGRIQGDLFACRRVGDLVLETTRDQRDTLLAWFNRYIIMDDVELTPLDGKLTAIGIAGPDALAVLKSIDLVGLVEQWAPDSFSTFSWRGKDLTLFRSSDPHVTQFELWINPADVSALWSALINSGATSCGSHAVEMLRILAGTPRYGVDIRSRDLPQETNQSRALHFAKGCYLGQEIVERIRSRGSVHRSFEGFLLTGDLPPVGAPIVFEDKAAGELTSVTTLPDGRHIALGYARRELVERDMTFHYEGGTARVTPLPFQPSLK